ncbi:unnamed protein product [Paramecium octaurelia]|uniref:Transmembrane protein n=1 Tax=Paramecium octaurelia TaxID=43137 RepID=A0A8S1UMM7_PAROT|nr:unnamed protein product [Paramecium octaurelia]
MHFLFFLVLKFSFLSRAFNCYIDQQQYSTYIFKFIHQVQDINGYSNPCLRFRFFIVFPKRNINEAIKLEQLKTNRIMIATEKFHSEYIDSKIKILTKANKVITGGIKFQNISTILIIYKVYFRIVLIIQYIMRFNSIEVKANPIVKPLMRGRQFSQMQIQVLQSSKEQHYSFFKSEQQHFPVNVNATLACFVLPFIHATSKNSETQIKINPNMINMECI